MPMLITISLKFDSYGTFCMRGCSNDAGFGDFRVKNVVSQNFLLLLADTQIAVNFVVWRF